MDPHEAGLNPLPLRGGVYSRLAPADHTSICWAAAIGTASRGSPKPAEVIAAAALEMLAAGSGCLCRPQSRGTTGRRTGRK